MQSPFFQKQKKFQKLFLETLFVLSKKKTKEKVLGFCNFSFFPKKFREFWKKE